MLSALPYGCLSVQAAGNALLVRLSGGPIALTEENARWLRAELFHLVQRPEVAHLLLDLGTVDYLNSTTVEVLLALHRCLKARGGRLAVCSLTPPVAEIFDVLRLGDVLPVLARAADDACSSW